MDAIHPDTAMGWELFGRAAVRKGRYKLVHIEPKVGGREDGGWQLYDLSQDPGEIHDLADSHPEKVKELLDIWEQYRSETGVVWGKPVQYTGELWDETDESFVGGNAIEQTLAWMKVTHGEAPPS